jgi:hypothetical protein
VGRSGGKGIVGEERREEEGVQAEDDRRGKVWRRCKHKRNVEAMQQSVLVEHVHAKALKLVTAGKQV